MTDRELCFTSAVDLVASIGRKKVSPLEVVGAVLARIEKVNPALNAYCTVAAEQALAASELRFRIAFHANPAPQLLTTKAADRSLNVARLSSARPDSSRRVSSPPPKRRGPIAALTFSPNVLNGG